MLSDLISKAVQAANDYYHSVFGPANQPAPPPMPPPSPIMPVMGGGVSVVDGEDGRPALRDEDDDETADQEWAAWLAKARKARERQAREDEEATT